MNVTPIPTFQLFSPCSGCARRRAALSIDTGRPCIFLTEIKAKIGSQVYSSSPNQGMPSIRLQNSSKELRQLCWDLIRNGGSKS